MCISVCASKVRHVPWSLPASPFYGIGHALHFLQAEDACRLTMLFIILYYSMTRKTTAFRAYRSCYFCMTRISFSKLCCERLFYVHTSYILEHMFGRLY